MPHASDVSLFPCACADDMQKGLRPRRSVRQAMAHEIMFYSIGEHLTVLNASPGPTFFV